MPDTTNDLRTGAERLAKKLHKNDLHWVRGVRKGNPTLTNAIAADPGVAGMHEKINEALQLLEYWNYQEIERPMVVRELLRAALRAWVKGVKDG